MIFVKGERFGNWINSEPVSVVRESFPPFLDLFWKKNFYKVFLMLIAKGANIVYVSENSHVTS